MPGIQELLVILLIVIIIFGASKLPQLGKGLGEGIKNFKKGLKSDDEEAGSEFGAAVADLGDVVVGIQVARAIGIVQPDTLAAHDMQGAVVEQVSAGAEQASPAFQMGLKRLIRLFW